MGNLKVCVISTVLLTSVVLSIITAIKLVNFLSAITNNATVAQNVTLRSEHECCTETRWSALIDTTLLSLFIIQHSFILPLLQKTMALLQAQELERSVFNILSSVAIQILMYFWIPIKDQILWRVDVFDNYSMWLLFNGFQYLGWTIIYVHCLVMDLTYLLGVKQVYYYLTGRPAPFTLRTPAFRHFSSTMTHSLFGFFLVLWAYPHMSLDRFLMAVILSLFMLIGIQLTDNDYNYLIEQDRRKRAEL